MKIEIDEFHEWLNIEGVEYGCTETGNFEVLASHLEHATLADIPPGVVIHLCNRVIGSKELYRRGSCRFEHNKEGTFIAHADTFFFIEDEKIDVTAKEDYFKAAFADGKKALTPFSDEGKLLGVEESIYEDIAYLSYSLQLPNQPITDAEYFMEAVEARVRDGVDQPLLFICHASEDKPFVEQLVSELDRRALHAWFDKREILVGDSIVDRINEALTEARYVIVVLSPISITKSWLKRELNSTLMRQLAMEHVTLLPVLLEDCAIPPLLTDLKYADFRTSFDDGFTNLLAAVRSKAR